MYNYIKGTLESIGDGYIVVENAGIGYNIYTSLVSSARLREEKLVKVFTYLYIREGIMDIYGFSTEEEKKLFMQLISISGVGPKAAISILSIAPTDQIALAIVTGNTALIKKAQGVGPKAAQRIVLELKDKLKNIAADTTEEDFISISDADNISEALNALLVLGYSQSEARSALKGIDNTLDTEDIIKQALKRVI